jgi:hypothetical protein
MMAFSDVLVLKFALNPFMEEVIIYSLIAKEARYYQFKKKLIKETSENKNKFSKKIKISQQN